MDYSCRDIFKAIKHPRLILDEIEYIYYSCINTVMDDTDRVDILSEDWDVLVIFDACRYKTFADIVELPGTLRKVRSKASSTDQFLRQNFDERNASDIAYITGNPQFYRIQNGIYNVDPINCQFYETVNVWKDNWDDEHRTVRPELVTDAAIDAAEAFPNKRIIIHYLQPHTPYIGQTGLKQLPTDMLDFWKSFRMGDINVDIGVAKKAYRENLELVLNEVERLFDAIDGKIVLTADHGEMLGERRGLFPTKKYGHPPGIHTRELIEVPWFVHTTGTRRDIVAGEPTKANKKDVADETVKQRLQQLGYVNGE
jgi:hypothetical protein